MKTIFVFLFSFLTIGLIQAQYAGGGTPSSSTTGSQFNSQAGQAISLMLGSISDADIKRQEKEITDAVGSPYTSNNFTMTQLFYNEEKVGNILYRYNALNEEIEIKKTSSEKGYSALTKDKMIGIMVDGKRMAFNTFITSKNRTTNGYLTDLVKGSKYDLYKRITVKYTEGTPAQNSFVAAVPARFTQFTEYYYQKKGVNRIDELIVKNSKLLKILNDSEKVEVKLFIKENKLNIKNENDLIKVFEFINSK